MYILQRVALYLEDQSTGTGAQRFKVVRLEWRDDLPLPAWFSETRKRDVGVTTEGT
jgi:hypothetical protein